MQTQQQTATAQVRVKRKYTKRKQQLRLVTSATAQAQAAANATTNATTNATAKRNSALHTQRMLNFATAQMLVRVLCMFKQRKLTKHCTLAKCATCKRVLHTTQQCSSCKRK
jgi:hypothetical protein